jgi:hypothetical protein
MNLSRTETLASLLATPLPPALRFTPRAGTLSVAAVEAALSGSDRERDIVTALALLWHDQYEASHALCQAREGDADADYVHWLLHRREGDAANAAYWAGEVAGHPLFAEVGTLALRLGLGELVGSDGCLQPLATTHAQLAPAGRETALIALQAGECRLLGERLVSDALRSVPRP